ncbi:hypothetical protein GCM10023094_05500 [Rhodococcus olei]|uniref:DUF4386 family protein n=1 Tax=Rhodococcus olei TaxID=2161675 RepID=A0ABP8NT23_9NOCA
MSDRRGAPRLRPLTTPRAAAVAGIVFAVLFGTSLVLLRVSLPDNPFAPWRGQSRITTALVLAPLAGIAFLWFVGVVRDRLGDLEDRFFATVVLGSGLLFLALFFASSATAGAVLAYSRHIDTDTDPVVSFGREVMLQIGNVYAVRMAAVFMISLATIWWRTGVMPRVMVAVTYLVALALLLVVSLSLWATLAFPTWVLLISTYILVVGPIEAGPETSPGTGPPERR